MIPIYKPYLPAQSLKYAHDALDSTWISSQGKYIQIAQERLQELLKVSHVLLVNNGTSACHLVAKALYYAQPPAQGKKKIIVPTNVYVAAWNAFIFDDNYTLIPVDANIDTWNIDSEKLHFAIQNNPGADVLIVHNIGNIINVPALQQKYPAVRFVEDNCEGFLGYYDDVLSGTASFASAISFFGNKNITSGEGGAVITNNKDAYEFVRCVHGQGQSNKRFIHKELGYNYRMTNIQAAILCGQFEILQEIQDRKNSIFERYRQAFDNRTDIKIQISEPGTSPANWLFGIRVPNLLSYEQTEVYFATAGIEIRPMFYSIFEHVHIKNNPNILSTNCDNAILLNKSSLVLPSYPELTIEEQSHIIRVVNKYVGSLEIR